MQLLKNKLPIKTVVGICVKCFISLIIIVLLTAVIPTIVSAPQVSAEYKAGHSYEDVISSDVSGERALFMPTSYSSFFRRLVLVENAESSIDFVVHNSNLDDGGQLFYGALLSAADRGVKVRVLTDGKVNRIAGTRLYEVLASHKNIEFYVYNSFNILRIYETMFILHDKFIVVDNKYLIVGGANTGYRDFIANEDAEVLVSGGDGGKSSAVGQVNEYFDSLLNCYMTVRVTGNYGTIENDYKNLLIDKFYSYYNEGYLSDPGYSAEAYDKNPDYSKLGHAVNKITLLTNPITGTKRAANILYSLTNFTEKSGSARFLTPYFVYGDGVVKQFKQLSSKYDVSIQTNSLSNTPNIAFGVYSVKRKNLVKDITFYEYQGDMQIHAKVATFGDNLSVVGSFNLDERSTYLDTEAALAICGEEFTNSVTQFLDAKKNESLRVHEDNTYEQNDVQERPTPDRKRALYMFYGILGYPFIQAL